MVLRKRQRTDFNVPNYGAPNRKGVKKRWRKQRGIDNKKRVKKLNRGPVPKIGYKNSDALRNARPDGSFEFIVHNKQELISVLNMPGYCAKFAHALSTRKRIELLKLANEQGIKVLNRM